MRIIHKFFIVFLLIGLLIGTAGYTAIVESQRALVKAIGHETVSLASALMHEIDHAIFERINFLQIYALNKDLATLAKQSSKDLSKQINHHDSIQTIDNDWKQNRNTAFIQTVLNNSLSIQFAELIASYEKTHGYQVFSEIFLTNTYGVVIASSARTSDYLQADELWYQQAKASNEDFWVGQVKYDESSDTFGIRIVINLYDDAREHVGILKAILHNSDSIHVIKENRSTPYPHFQNLDTQLITSKGEMIYSSRQEKPMQLISQDILSGFSQDDAGNGYFMPQDNIEGRERGLYARAHSTGYKNYSGLGWSLIVGQDEEDIFLPVIQLRNKILGLLGFTLLACSLFSLLMARSVKRPLNQLSAASKAIGQGQLDTRLDIKSNDEMGLLASTINEMAGRLQQTTVSKTYLDNIVENMTDSIIVISSQGTINKVNRTTLNLLDYHEQELLGQPIASLFAEADDENQSLKEKGIENLINLGSVRNIEKSYLTKDGRKIPVLFSAAVMHDDSGAVQGLVCAALDITERKQAEQKLHEKSIDLSERVRELNCLFAMATVIEATGIDEYELCNRAVKIIPQGWRYPEITCAVITLDNKSFHSRKFEQTDWVQTAEISINGVKRGKVEVFYLEQRPAQHEGPFLREERALLNHLTAQLTKTFEKIALDNAVRDSEERNRLLLDSSSDGIYAIDREGICTICNPSAAHMLGYESAEQIIGKNTHHLFHHTRADGSEYPQEECSLMQMGFESEILLEDELFWRQDGSPMQVEYRAAPMKRNGETMGCVVSFTDMTERHNIDLQLRQAQKLESIGQLASGIAHEINTPAQFVSDNTTFLSEAFNDYKELMAAYENIRHLASTGEVSESMLKAVDELAEEKDIEYLNDEIPQAIKQSQEGLERITKIVRAMKEFSHPGVEEKTPVDINKALETTINVSRNEWRYYCDVKMDFDPDLPQIPCLPGEINQIFLNLIVNASHAIANMVGNSGVMGVIRIATRQDGDWLEIAVSDTGCGISENKRERIFDPFFTTKAVGKGTGQGLAIVYSSVVDKHKGTIRVESEVGKGSTFTIRLPMKQDTV